MVQPDAVIFDLDGTLWDTTEACVIAWNRVARELGVADRTVTIADMHRVTGLAHTEAVRRVFEGLSDDEIELLSERTQLEDNRLIGESGGKLYDGVSELVPELAHQLPLHIVSNCQSGYIEIFLKTSGLASHFTDHECWGDTGLSKSENLASIVRRHALRTPWFVGDTEGDRTAARANGLQFVHAAYGFGQVSDCDARIERFAEIASLLSV